MVTIIAAKAANNVIGKDNKLPWNFPEDLKRFKEITAGHPVVMGWNTFLSIIMQIGKILPGRYHLVLTSKKDDEARAAIAEVIKDKFPDFDFATLNANVHFCRFYANAIQRAESKDSNVFVIGGERVFVEALKDAGKLELTEVKGDYEGDAFFPEFDSSNWDREELEENMHSDFSFVTYSRKRHSANGGG